jgi:hypothetical protein
MSPEPVRMNVGFYVGARYRPRLEAAGKREADPPLLNPD